MEKKSVALMLVVAADGKTVTRVVKGVDAQGKAYQSTEVYDRQ